MASTRKPSSLQSASSATCRNRDDQEACRFCGSYSLIVDWKQGDKVCTTCGVVAEERILEDRPEWKDFNEAEDLAKGAPKAARCGMVPVNESKYLGGLQPTTLSKVPFGGQPGPSCNSDGSTARVAMIRKRLISSNRKMDRMMGQRHARTLNNARVSRLVRKRQLADGDTTDTDLDSVVTADDDLRPEFEQILIQEEEDANRMQAALNSDKWSLKRAILIFGQQEPMSCPGDSLERDDLEKRVDSKLRKASSDLYQAYQMLLDAARRLQLPDRVIHEATDNLCRFVTRRDGFSVKGVCSRLNLKKNNLSAAQQKKATDNLREYNKSKQMGSLCAALLLLTARKLGWPRPLTEVCGAIQPMNKCNTDASFIKAKHCSRAMDEIKATLPDFARTLVAAPTNISDAANSHNSPADDPVSTTNFVDHAVRKLFLPPVAGASVRALVWQCVQEQTATGQSSGTRLSTLCASLAYFVCLSGSVMQQLASQAQSQEKQKDSRSRKSRFVFTRKNNMGPPPAKLPKLIHVNEEIFLGGACNEKVGEFGSKANNDKSEFDVFSHKVGKELMIQKKEYEMRRVWDTWAEQTSWLRSLSEIERSSGVSSNTILSHYKSSIYPRRQALLESLKGAVVIDAPNSTKLLAVAAGRNRAAEAPVEDAKNMLTETPLAQVLLSHVVAAAPLLNPSGRQLVFGCPR